MYLDNRNLREKGKIHTQSFSGNLLDKTACHQACQSQQNHKNVTNRAYFKFFRQELSTAKGDAIKTRNPQKPNVISKKENNQSKQIQVTYDRVRWIVP